MKTQDELKKIAGYKAAELVEDGMTVGLGTGSTVRYLLDALGERIKKKTACTLPVYPLLTGRLNMAVN